MNSPSSQSQALSSVPSSEPPSSSSPSPHASNPFASTDSLTTPTGGGTPDTSAPGTPAGAIRRKPIRRANTAERRATHNAVERQRRETLNSRFLVSLRSLCWCRCLA
ncbi:hypothetical protein DL93DRAFT_2064828 [Clavulina sp. PMI_390]|nr:hypothetical protein DL93DRAFT_2064828 [Clavulina sp. PMI_390]